MLLVTQVGHLSALAETQIMARVKSDRVNLRAKSDLQAETVSQLSSGDMLAVRTVKDEWVEVVPPENADFWVHKEFVGDDTVLVARLNARSGAGINYNVVGSFVKGDKITRRGTFGEWIKVAAPADASLWVHRSLVELVYPGSTIPPPIAAPATPNPSEEISTYYDNSSEQPSPDNLTTTYEEEPWPSSGRTPPAVSSSGPPSDLKLVPLSGQGKVVQREGQLKRAPRLLFNSPGTHRLVKREGNKIITTAYLRGNSQQLDSLLEQNLVVQGREYWVENVRVPVIIIEGIEKRSFY
jgi:SH3-like domain-containing protein